MTQPRSAGLTMGQVMAFLSDAQKQKQMPGGTPAPTPAQHRYVSHAPACVRKAALVTCPYITRRMSLGGVCEHEIGS